MCRFFYPTIQLRPTAGARTLLHIGTHRKEYKDLDPNHLYYMQWRCQGLVKSPFVEDGREPVSIRLAFYFIQEIKECKHEYWRTDGIC